MRALVLSMLLIPDPIGGLPWPERPWARIDAEAARPEGSPRALPWWHLIPWYQLPTWMRYNQYPPDGEPPNQGRPFRFQ